MLSRSALLAAVATIALVGTASAQSVSGFYIGGGAGVSLLQDIDGTYKPAGSKGNEEYKTGYGLLGALGYGYSNGFRSELEIAWNDFKAKNSTQNLGSGITATTGGNASAFTVMGNALYDFNLGLPVTPYLGVGLGWMRLNA